MTEGGPGLPFPSLPDESAGTESESSGNPFLMATGGAPSVTLAAPTCGNPFVLASGGAPPAGPTAPLGENSLLLSSGSTGGQNVPSSGNPLLKGPAVSSVIRPSGNPLLMGSGGALLTSKKQELAKSDESDDMSDADSETSLKVTNPNVERYTFVPLSCMTNSFF